MRKHLTALLAAAALTLSAAPLTALAKEEPPGSMLPDWVPRDYLAAVDFCNTYGKTHIHDGYVCIVRKAYLDETPQPDFTETHSEEPIEQFMPQFIISSRPDEVVDPVPQRYAFQVSLYQPSKPGELKITWGTKEHPDAGETFTFDVAEDGSITETDLFGWLPDSPAEFADFDKENPVLSVHDGYIVYAGSPCYDGGYQEYLSVVGSGAVELIGDYGIGRTYADVEPCGGSPNILKLYKPVRPGTVQITATEKRSWEKDPVYSDTGYYQIADDLTVTETASSEALLGDCNGDGELNVMDLIAMSKYLHGKGTLAKPELSDLDGDGQVDIFDFAELRQFLLVQSPWKDGKLEFTSETVVNPSPYRPENHKACDIKWYGNLDATQSYLNDFDKADAVKLKEITEETFKDHAVLTVASRAGAGDRRFTVESVERRGSRLIVHTDTYHTMFPTPDMAVIYNVIAVDKSVMDGIKDYVVENQDNYQAIT